MFKNLFEIKKNINGIAKQKHWHHMVLQLQDVRLYGITRLHINVVWGRRRRRRRMVLQSLQNTDYQEKKLTLLSASVQEIEKRDEATPSVSWVV